MKSDFDHSRYQSLFDVTFSDREELIDLAARSNFELVEVKTSSNRRLFDDALNKLHYSGACQRVGRCMRLMVIMNNTWIGGIVLGSPFPNILVRDEALGLRVFITDYKDRNLSNPWSSRNVPYWKSLQKIVNHARAFVFPKYQGAGLGIRSQSLLFTQGVRLWEEKYKDEVFAFDNLCDKGDSKLFLYNGWTLVGTTKGYTSSSETIFSKRAFREKNTKIKNNIGLSMVGRKWEVWIRVVNQAVFENLHQHL